ncbi:hypothetical protein QBC46DRAFT_344115 [Diplogelasinospora grovesii]|uniref:Uncharacterized protein n=1 Tax=Diplogelasinospora grovesii TaxID=303347 RepID=A0AAN6N2D8_9PEZI|nr:hypothetical protein QBC46DRAFT_344115 [Diplogelasinospora grovesii]
MSRVPGCGLLGPLLAYADGGELGELAEIAETRVVPFDGNVPDFLLQKLEYLVLPQVCKCLARLLLIIAGGTVPSANLFIPSLPTQEGAADPQFSHTKPRKHQTAPASTAEPLPESAGNHTQRAVLDDKARQIRPKNARALARSPPSTDASHPGNPCRLITLFTLIHQEFYDPPKFASRGLCFPVVDQKLDVAGSLVALRVPT